MQELGLANPRLAGTGERPTVRPCVSPEDPEPVHFRVAPSEVTGWRAAAGPFVRLWDAGVEHGTLSRADPTGPRHSVDRRHPAGKQGRSGALP
jgi:hypothetical protein